jgi:aminopeptidase YwaD
MKSKNHILFIFLLVSFDIFPQDISYEKGIINKLSSEKFHGRGYTFNGVNLAARYLVSEFRNNGLKSFGKDYFQPFSIDVNTFPGNLKIELNGQKLLPGKDFIVQASSPSLKGQFNIISINLADLDNGFKLHKAIDKAGKGFLLVDERIEDTLSVERLRRFNSIKDALMFSKDINLSGLIFLSEKSLTMGVSSVQAARPLIIIHSDQGELKNINKISLRLNSKLKQNYETGNVIGFVEGTAYPDTFIVLTAHYDHLGQLGRKVYFPGANDNASGIAMLLGLAEYFSENPPEYSLAFMAFSAEEVGLLGSGYYVEQPLFDLGKIRFLVNFDLAGTGDEGIKVVNGTIFKREFSLLQLLNEKNQYLPSVQIRGEACNSDHCKFYLKGVPSFFIYTLGGANYYHDIFDTPDNLSLSGFKGYKNLMIDFIENF